MQKKKLKLQFNYLLSLSDKINAYSFLEVHTEFKLLLVIIQLSYIISLKKGEKKKKNRTITTKTKYK